MYFLTGYNRYLLFSWYYVNIINRTSPGSISQYVTHKYCKTASKTYLFFLQNAVFTNLFTEAASRVKISQLFPLGLLDTNPKEKSN
jgi:hypothetical protein